MAELSHINHRGITLELVDGELRIRDKAAVKNITSAHTVSDDDHDHTLRCDGTFALTLPDLGDVRTVVTVFNVGGGTISFTAGSDASITPADVVLDDADADEITIAVAHHRGDGAWDVVASKPYVRYVFYDNGWPASRPYARTVVAVGGGSAPAWLTNTDVWKQDMS